MRKKVTIAGAGLVGSLEAIYLSKKGFEVEVFERRPDIRKVELDLSQMKANMNAVDGALQQMRKLINKAQKSDEKEGKEK